MKYITTINDKTYTIEINDDHHITLDGVEYGVDLARIGDQPVYTLLLNGQSFEGFVYEGEAADVWEVLLHGGLYTALVEDEREKRLRTAGGVAAASASGEYHLKAPMPGLVVAVPVEAGQAIKIQNELKAPRDGTVARIKVKPGDSVEHHQVLISVT